MLMSKTGKDVFKTKQKGSLLDIFDKPYGPSAASVKQDGPSAASVEQDGPSAASVEQDGPSAATVKPPYLIATCGSGVGIIQVTLKKSKSICSVSI